MSTGSGFFFKIDNIDYLVTAKHVLFEGDILRCKTILISSQNYKGAIDNTRMFEIDASQVNIIPSSQDDIAIIPFGNIEKSELSGHITIVQEGTITPLVIDDTSIRLLEDIKIANDVFLVGFPTSLIFQNSKHFDPGKPLLRKGIVAGINSLDNTFIIDCSAYYGNSGGPIIEHGEDGTLRLIGVVSRYIPFVIEWKNNRERSITHNEFLNSGYSVCTPVDAIIKLI
jgi:hypothetical protein